MADDAQEAAALNALTESGRYELAVAALGYPLLGHLVFNGLAGLSIALIGHPMMGLAAFALAMGFDAGQELILRRWRPRMAEVSDRVGMRRISILAAGRTIAGLAPITWLAFTGGAAELLLFMAMLVWILSIGLTMGTLSRGLFWCYLGPMLAAMTALTVAHLGPVPAAGVGLTLVVAAMVLWNIADSTNRLMDGSREAFRAKRTLVEQLEAARDEARQANRAKSNFLATMSHEIRTPMNGVLGMAQLLKRDEVDPRQRERIDVLIDSGEYLLSILNDILDVSKIDAGKLDIVPAPEALRPFLSRLVGFWGARADEKGVTLRLDIAAEVPACVLVDGLRLRQVLFNLVGNALKFTDEGLVEISASARPNGRGATLLHLTVRDTGPGIAPEHLPALFDRFSQADASEVRRFGGTGLGLAIAKQLVELMSGKIWAESTPGKGAAFHVRLPLAVAETAMADAATASEAEDDGGLGALDVLAVDDNAVNLLVLEQLLSSLGCRVTKAESGAEALEALAHEPFDLVLMDIQMPGMTGIEALQRLRAGEGPNAGVPVVALTADVTSGGRDRYLTLGFDEHSTKPIQIEALMNTMAAAVTARTRTEVAA